MGQNFITKLMIKMVIFLKKSIYEMEKKRKQQNRSVLMSTIVKHHRNSVIWQVLDMYAFVPAVSIC